LLPSRHVPHGAMCAAFNQYLGSTPAPICDLCVDAGVVKDWILIGLSVWLYAAPVTAINLGGYLVAFVAVLW